MPIISIQYLRAIAALFVVIHHISVNDIISQNENINFTYQFGTFGVDIFFVISGFIMWVTTTGKNTLAWDFIYRRATRVAPIYWIATIVTVSISTNPELTFFTDIDYERTIKSIFFIPHFHAEEIDSIFPVLVVGWTLNYEMFFYLLFGLSLVLNKTYRYMAIISALTILPLLGYFLEPKIASFIVYTNSLLIEFAFGISIAWLYINKNVFNIKWGVALILISIVLLYFELISAGYRGLDKGIPAAILVLGALCLEDVISKRPIPVVLALGDSSYSLYLWHGMAIAFISAIWGRVFEISYISAVLFIFVCLIGSSLAGYFIFRILENPLHSFFKKILSLIKYKVSTA